MQDEAIVKVYGNQNLPEGRPDRPLVTFAVFAYNQEKYIREAVEGAFSQTYSPLEIILSDDCSTDRTFQIMEELAAAYRGPHQVKVWQGKRNLGLIEHVNDIVARARTDFIVFAAGDDISVPHRTTKIVKIFTEYPNIALVHSNVRLISEDGRYGAIVKPPLPDMSDLISMAVSLSIYIGATGAINTNLYKVFGRITETETYEDLILGFRAALLDGFYHINEDLVLYRANIGLSTEYSRKAQARLPRRIRYIKHKIATLRQRQLDAMKVESVVARGLCVVISRELDFAQAQLMYHTSPKTFLRQLLLRPRFSNLKAMLSETIYILRTIVMTQ